MAVTVVLLKLRRSPPAPPGTFSVGRAAALPRATFINPTYAEAPRSVFDVVPARGPLGLRAEAAEARAAVMLLPEPQPELEEGGYSEVWGVGFADLPEDGAAREGEPGDDAEFRGRVATVWEKPRAKDSRV